MPFGPAAQCRLPTAFGPFRCLALPEWLALPNTHASQGWLLLEHALLVPDSFDARQAAALYRAPADEAQALLPALLAGGAEPLAGILSRLAAENGALLLARAVPEEAGGRAASPDALAAAAIRLLELPNGFARLEQPAFPAPGDGHLASSTRLEVLPLPVQARAALQFPGTPQETCLLPRRHLRVRFGPPAGKLLRVHSTCLTGDLCHSRRCDCGAQLRLSVQHLRAEGGTLLLHDAEGRGVGLTLKIHMYAWMQETGGDTYAAMQAFGYHADERNYVPVADLLRQAATHGWRLLTNNPEKQAALERAGLAVAGTQPLRIAATDAATEGYLLAKRRRGHRL